MIAEFFSMGGFGLYIWSSFGLTFLLMLAEILYLRQQRRTTLNRIKKIRKMQQAGRL